MKTRSIIAFLMALCCLQAMAQIKYSERESLSIGCDPDPNYGITTKGFDGIYFSGPALFFVDIEHTFTYMRGSGWAVYFYDAARDKYSDIRAAAVRTSANGEIYDSWIDDEGDVGILRSLNPVSYAFKPESGETSVMRSKTTEPESRHIGFLAQEVETIIPQAVTTDEDGRKNVNYNSFLPVIVRSIKALSRQSVNNRERLQQIREALGSN